MYWEKRIFSLGEPERDSDGEKSESLYRVRKEMPHGDLGATKRGGGGERFPHRTGERKASEREKKKGQRLLWGSETKKGAL